MKKLQNNFTTPEQSKRLLKLGVPTDSADCYYDSLEQIQWRQLRDLDHDFFQKYNSYIPCWSVGRLIEIMKICAKPKEQAKMVEEILYCKDLVELLVCIIVINKQVIDFSKLEE